MPSDSRPVSNSGVIHLLATACLLVAAGPTLAQQLPPPPVPQANPITEAKRVLGKILFWDEQLSSDNTMSCGTCHSPGSGGVDPRRLRNPGLDAAFNTPDDIFGSAGVIRSNASRNYVRDNTFALAPRVTGRSSMDFGMASYVTGGGAFWDGRARPQFVDPQTNQQVLTTNAALESQSVGPPVNDVEMAHEGRDWAQISTKLASARPLAVATNIPTDMLNALTARPAYAQLFQDAFGTPQINASRIAQAIATYERTVIPNDTPWDRFIAGNPNAMTPGQIQGWNFFQGSRCSVCHAAPVFTNQTFRNIGVRPPDEDLGRQLVTGSNNDRGRFKVPSLRNVGLRPGFMHNGQITSILNVVRFYDRSPGAPPMFNDNRDPLVPVPVPGNVQNALVDFLTNGLTDARARNQTFPFDRPTLFTQRPENQAQLLGGGTAGAGGQVPQIIAVDPAFVGNPDFRIGVHNARGGALARVMVSTQPPVGGRLLTGTLSNTMLLSAGGNGAGIGTFHWPIGANGLLQGRDYYFQWQVFDAAATGGLAFSGVVRFNLFCGGLGCPSSCPADRDLDGSLTPDDLSDYIATYFGEAGPAADFNADGSTDPDDLSDYIAAFFGGCAA